VFLFTLVALILSLVYDAEKGLHLSSTHSKVSVAVLVILAVQLLTALARPPPMPKTALRRLFEVGHRVLAASAFGTGIAAVFTGLTSIHLHGVDNTTAFVVSTIVVLCAWAALCMYGEAMPNLCKVSDSAESASPPQPDAPPPSDVEKGPPAKDGQRRWSTAWAVPLALFCALTLGLAIWSGVDGRADSSTIVYDRTVVAAAGSECGGSCVEAGTFWLEFDMEISRFDAPLVDELRCAQKLTLMANMTPLNYIFRSVSLRLSIRRQSCLQDESRLCTRREERVIAARGALRVGNRRGELHALVSAVVSHACLHALAHLSHCHDWIR
jgi:hypothetical protein